MSDEAEIQVSEVENSEVTSEAQTADAVAHSGKDDSDSLREQLEEANKRADEAEKKVSGADKQAKQERLKRHAAEEAREEAKSQAAKTGEKVDLEAVANLAVEKVNRQLDADKESDKITQANQKQASLDESFDAGMKKAVTDKRLSQEDLDGAFDKVGRALGSNPSGLNIANFLKGRPDAVAVLALLAKEESFMKDASTMSENEAALVIGRLENSFQSNQTTIAPNPSSNLSGSSVVQKDPDDMTHAEYKKYLQDNNNGSVFI